jgi:hypothetical protein
MILFLLSLGIIGVSFIAFIARREIKGFIMGKIVSWLLNTRREEKLEDSILVNGKLYIKFRYDGEMYTHIQNTDRRSKKMDIILVKDVKETRVNHLKFLPFTHTAKDLGVDRIIIDGVEV